MTASEPAMANFLLGLGMVWGGMVQVGDDLEVVRELNYK